MDFSLSSERQILFDTLMKYIMNEYSLDDRNEAALSDLGFSKDRWESIRALGVFEALLKPEHGGFGGAAIDITTVFEALGSGLVIEPILNSALICSIILSHGSEQHKLIAEDILNGKARPIFGHFEDFDQYELASIHSKVSETNTHFIVNGTKSSIKHLVGASHFIFSARTSGQNTDLNGITLFIIPLETDGLTIDTFESIDGGRVSDLKLTNVKIEKDALIGPKDGAISILSEVVDIGTLAFCAEALGIMEKIKEITLKYLKTRKQFGVIIGKFQTLQHRMTQLLIEIEQTRSAVMNASFWYERDTEMRKKMLCAAKYTVGRVGKLVAEESIQMHGGMGMTWEYELGHFAKRLIMINHEFGDDDFHLNQYIKLGT